MLFLIRLLVEPTSSKFPVSYTSLACHFYSCVYSCVSIVVCNHTACMVLHEMVVRGIMFMCFQYIPTKLRTQVSNLRLPFKSFAERAATWNIFNLLIASRFLFSSSVLRNFSDCDLSLSASLVINGNFFSKKKWWMANGGKFVESRSLMTKFSLRRC